MNPLSLLRILLVAPLSWLAWRRAWRALAVGTLAAVATDVLDGRLARYDARFADARLDSLADRCLTYAVCAWLLRLEPSLPRWQPRLLALAAALWAALMATSWRRFGRVGALHLASARLGGAVQALFALDAFWRGRPRPALWRGALLTFIVAAAEEWAVHLLRRPQDEEAAIRSVWPLLRRR